MAGKLKALKKDPGASDHFPTPDEVSNWIEFVCRSVENWDLKTQMLAKRYHSGPLKDERKCRAWVRVGKSLDRAKNHLETAMAYTGTIDEE